ncbi:MAG TPA: UDP-N-acetylmuramoyl-L-alanyl-D-glutamate--2,6-diaminopimelate ligase [Candidatus Binataceae bacterium]|nr:UDP-N-acetylmuramoyl-L-alanyl-D-glutamate--2,6-diaminopimelate ligase [Candidatus Binataceae bacterium]
MKLAELIAGESDLRVHGDAGVEVAGLAYDSRRVKPGDLFFSLARDPEQARANIDDALNRGARVVVMRKGWDGEGARPAVTVVQCEWPRRLMGAAASRFFNAPSRRLELVGVTGTSGKTTTAYLLASIFEAAGAPPGVIGTIGIFVGPRKIYSGLTTPESLDFESALAEMERAGVRRVAAEISSIGLAEERADRLSFRACVFTNLGRDHLDYHGTQENYFAAKLRLFSDLLPKSTWPDAVAVVRGDDPFGRRVLDAVRGRKVRQVRSVSFGLEPGLDVHPLSYSAGTDGIRASVAAFDKRIEVRSPLLGEINLLNILGASAVSVALGIETEVVAEGLRRCPGAPGRLEAVPGPPGVTVLVDYAHKPDALEAVLRALRGLKPRRVVCVFGCGGDRDRGKRPLMGGIAGRMADLAILTSDNPRSEDPLAIIAEVEAGLTAAGLGRIAPPAAGNAPGYLVEPDRRAAIALGLEVAAPGDIVLIAGKGHEDYQLVAGRRLDFDDRAVVRALVAERGHVRGA